MSAEIPPDPITNTFNPAAWNVPELTDEERALLDANYIKFPIAQNAPITFPSSITAPTQLNTDNSTLVATTAWGNLFWNYVRSITNTWTGTQTFSGTITSTVIAPTTSGGTLNIGNAAANVIFVAGTASRSAVLHLGDGDNATGGIHIGNGLASSNPVNILYSSTDAGASGTINLGSATGTINLRCPLTPTSLTYPLGSDKIGYIQSTTTATVAVTPNTVQNVRSLTLAAGVWFLQFDATLSVALTSGNYITIGFNTSSATLTGARASNTCIIQTGGTTPFSNNATTMIISINTSTTYNAVGLCNQTGTYNWTNPTFSATRIA